MQKLGIKNLCLLLLVLILSGCKGEVSDGFQMIVHADRAEPNAETPTENVFIKISPNGKGKYVIYDTGGSIVHDETGMVVYSRDQVRNGGTFKLTSSEMERLWQSIQDNAFFDLDDDYRMSIGGAYAFIVVETNEKAHIVDNIGMELPQVEKIIETLNAILPAEIELEYTQPGPW